jgi:hypothetical protein
MMVETGLMSYSDITLSNAEFAGFNSPHSSFAAYEEIGPQGALSSRPGLAQAVASAAIISAKNTLEFMSFPAVRVSIGGTVPRTGAGELAPIRHSPTANHRHP